MRKYLLFLLFSVTALFSQDYVSILCIFQNDAKYLKEWIDYHLKIGVDRLYLVNHLSTDNSEEVLAPYIQSGKVILYHCDKPVVGREFLLLQDKEYGRVFAEIRDKTRWLAVIDTDEFIVPVKHKHIKPFLESLEDKKIACVYIPWQCYGTSNVPSLSPGESILKLLTKKAVPDYPYNHWGKSISRTDRVATVRVHIPVLPKKFKIVLPSGKSLDRKCTLDSSRINKIPIEIDVARINHYWARDEWYFWNVKIPRYIDWGIEKEAIMEKYHAMNQVEDRILAD